MGDSSAVGDQTHDSDMIDLTGKVTVVAVIMLFLIVVFVFLLHVYAKWFWNRRLEESSNSNPAAPRRRRFEFASSYQELAALRQGIDPSVLKSIPVVIFTAKDFKDGLECAVCLCDVSEGEKTRLLPICNHGFHVECIDMWFQSHSSCPICRNLVSSDPNLSPETTTLESILESSPQLQNHENYTSESPPNFPTNVLFWGNDVEVRTLGNYMEEGQQAVSVPSSSFPSSSSSSNSNRLDGMLVIDIPQQINEDEEAKSPLPTRLRSVKRLLSRDNRRVGPCSPRDFDVEQATRS